MQPNKSRFLRVLAASALTLMTFPIVSAEVFEARYWFDQNTDDIRTCQVSSGRSTLTLPIGEVETRPVTQVNFQIKNTDGEWSPVYTQFFYSGRNADMSPTFSFDSRPTLHSVTGSYIDVASLHDGIHRVTVFDKKCNLSPQSALFYKNTSAAENMTLTFSSVRDGMSVEVPVKGGKTISEEIDVSRITPGIYPVNISLRNTADGRIVAVTNKLTDIRPVGGDRITGIYYWLDNGIEDSKKMSVTDGEFPYSITTDLDVSDLNVPTSDFRLSVSDDGP